MKDNSSHSSARMVAPRCTPVVKEAGEAGVGALRSNDGVSALSKNLARAFPKLLGGGSDIEVAPDYIVQGSRVLPGVRRSFDPTLEVFRWRYGDNPEACMELGLNTVIDMTEGELVKRVLGWVEACDRRYLAERTVVHE